MVTLQIEDATYQVPSRLEELCKKQLLACVGHLFFPDRPAAQAAVLLTLLPAAAKKQVRRFTDAQRLDVVRAVTAWMGKPHHTCPITSFRLGLTRYLLPRYERISLIETAKAQEALARWQKTQSEDALNLAVATLCRPRRLWLRCFPFARHYATGWDGDERERYNAEIVAARAKRMAGLPLAKKLLVVWHFEGMIATAKRQFAGVFAHSAPGSKPAPLIDTVFHLSGTELGDYRAVSHTPLVTVLYLIHTRLEAAAQQ